MRSTLLFLLASAVSGSVLQHRNAPSLPASAFTTFSALSLEDARAGKDLEGKHFNVTRVSMADLVQAGAAIPESPEAAACRASPGMRFEWRQYSTSDRQALMKAFQCLMDKPPSGNFPPAQNRFEDFARLHQKEARKIHGNPYFFAYHRYFIWVVEQVMRDECGFDRAFPWWDETKDAGNFAAMDMFSPAYLGNLLPPKENGEGWCIMSGAFGGRNLRIGPGDGSMDHCLTRAVNEEATAQCNQRYVDVCNARGTFAEFASCFERGPHAYGHNGIGGVMSDAASSPCDVSFYMHHLFVDHSYRIWQGGDPARLNTLNGNDADGNPLTLDTVISVGGIRPDVKIRDIINTLGGTVIAGVPFCYKYNY